MKKFAIGVLIAQSLPFLLILFLFVKCAYFPEDPKKAAEEKSLEIIKQATLISSDGDSLIYSMNMQENAFEDSYVLEAGTNAKELLKDLLSNGKLIAKNNVVIHFSAPSMDKYGNSGNSRFLSLSFNKTDIHRINFDNITPWDILNLSTKSAPTKFGIPLIGAFCTKSNNAKYSAQFCNNAADVIEGKQR